MSPMHFELVVMWSKAHPRCTLVPLVYIIWYASLKSTFINIIYILTY